MKDSALTEIFKIYMEVKANLQIFQKLLKAINYQRLKKVLCENDGGRI